MRPIRAIVIEDDAFARSTITGSLRLHGIEVVASCANAADAVRMAAETSPDVAVTDLHLGRGPSGAVLAHVLRRANPAIGIVLLTGHADPRSVGADPAQVPAGTEYVVKQSLDDVATLVLSVERAILAAPGAGTVRPATTAPGRAALTDAQVETLRLLAEGLTNGEIARRRGVTVYAIDRMLGRLFVALRLEDEPGYSRRALLVRAFESMTAGGA